MSILTSPKTAKTKQRRSRSATYTTRLAAHGKAQHLPLGQALREYAGAHKQGAPALAASSRAAGGRELSLAEGHGRLGRTFPPLRWMPDQAMQLLRDVPQLESAGVVVRMPAMWRANRPPQRASDSHRRWQAAIGTGANCASRFPLGSNPRWRKTHRGRDQRIARQAQRACFDSRALGSGRSAAAE